MPPLDVLTLPALARIVTPYVIDLELVGTDRATIAALARQVGRERCVRIVLTVETVETDTTAT